MRRFVSFLGLLALILILLDIALIASKRSLLVHVREYGAGEIIKTKKFGDVGGRDPAVVCTYWTGRAVWRFLDAPHRCVLLGTPTGIPIGE
jgi:hypothetical protein